MTVGGGRGVLHCNCVILYREGGGRLGKKGRMIGVRGREGGREGFQISPQKAIALYYCDDVIPEP